MFEGKNAPWEKFVRQAIELLASSSPDLRLLAQQGAAVDRQIVDRLIRTFHRIGGASQHFPIRPVSTLLEHMEAILTIWRESPAFIDSSAIGALEVAAEMLRKALNDRVPQSEWSILQAQNEILREFLSDAEWALLQNAPERTTPPFDLQQYPEEVAAATMGGRSLFALYLPLPRNRTEKQHYLAQMRERFLLAGDPVASVPRLGKNFELDKASTTQTVWILFSSALPQKTLAGLTQLPTENVIVLPLPKMIREVQVQVIPQKTVADTAIEAMNRLPEEELTELVLRMRQSDQDVVPLDPNGGEASFEERMAEMALLARQVRQANAVESSFAVFKKPIVVMILGIAITLLLVSWIDWFDDTSAVVRGGQAVTASVAPPQPTAAVRNDAAQGAVASVAATPALAILPAPTGHPASQENSGVVATVGNTAVVAPSSTVVAAVPTARAQTVVVTAPLPSQDNYAAASVTPAITHASTAQNSVNPLHWSTGRLTPILRKLHWSFTAITPPRNLPRGGLHVTYNQDGSVTCSIATLLNQVASRGGDRLTILPSTLPDIKLILQNTSQQAVMFDLDAAGTVTIAPAVWQSFIHSGAGFVTVSYLLDKMAAVPVIRDITALTTSTILERAKNPPSSLP